LPVVLDGAVHLTIDFEEADVLLPDIAAGEEPRGRADRAHAAPGNTARKDVVGALSAWIQIPPDAEVEPEGAEGRTNTAVDVDFSRGAVRKGDALGGGTDIELQILGDVVARLEIGGH